jgi:hypothetical protein
VFFLLPRVIVILLLVFGVLLVTRLGRAHGAAGLGRWLGRRWANRRRRS